MSETPKRSENLLWQNYRMLPEDFARMYHGQKGCCAICGVETPNLHVDHCHASGFVRGLLCQDCNIALGRFKDSRESLQRAIRYLVDWTADYRDACAVCWDASGDLEASIREPVHLVRAVQHKRAPASVMAQYRCECGHEWRTGWAQQFTPCILEKA